MIRLRHRYGVYPILCGLPALAAVALRTAACLTDLNFKTGYFGDGRLHLASCWLLFAAVVIALTYPLTHREYTLRADFSTPLTYIPTGVCGVALIFCALSLLVTLLRQTPLFPLLKFTRGMYGITATGFLASAERAVGLLTVLLAPWAVFHLFYTAFLPQGRSTRRANFGILCVLFFAMYAAYLYFNKDLPLNSPIKTVNQLAYLSCALFLLYETRVSLGRERWRLYIAFGMIAVAMTSYAAIPALVVYFAHGHLIAMSVAEIMLTLSVLLFALSRLFLTGRWAQSETAPFIDSLREAAEKRAMAVGGFDPQRQESTVTADVPAPESTDEDSQQLRWEFPMPGESIPAVGAEAGAPVSQAQADMPADTAAPDAGILPTGHPEESQMPQQVTVGEQAEEETPAPETAREIAAEQAPAEEYAEETPAEQVPVEENTEESPEEQAPEEENTEESPAEQVPVAENTEESPAGQAAEKDGAGVTAPTQTAPRKADTDNAEAQTVDAAGAGRGTADNAPAAEAAEPKRRRTVRVSVKETETQAPEENPNSGFRRISVKKKSPPRVPADDAPAKGSEQDEG